MSVTPVYKFALPLQNARVLLANCLGFQTLCGTVGNVNNTLAKIWFFETDEEHVSAQATLPRAIVSYQMVEFAANRTSTSGFVTTGPIAVRIEATTAQTVQQDGLLEWANTIGQILEEMQTLVTGSGQYLDVTKIVVEDFGRFDEPVNNGLRGHGCCLLIEWRGMNT